mmetsp:Transcript_23411/g.61502  ORF Transcript_23411/g.61502 Transcript_23411/m.61502 type:complete len:208 (-) Transcript_23411:43-666(-)
MHEFRFRSVCNGSAEASGGGVRGRRFVEHCRITTKWSQDLVELSAGTDGGLTDGLEFCLLLLLALCSRLSLMCFVPDGLDVLTRVLELTAQHQVVRHTGVADKRLRQTRECVANVESPQRDQHAPVASTVRAILFWQLNVVWRALSAHEVVTDTATVPRIQVPLAQLGRAQIANVWIAITNVERRAAGPRARHIAVPLGNGKMPLRH